ncbi:MAG: sodium:proton antiporter NhaD [Bacteroidetes bacterium]|nr:sodium:proton antiporter NhaD [Bacteroidota bacterium]
MLIALILTFVLGYVLITLEHKFHVNKAAFALLTGMLCWTIIALFPVPETFLHSEVYEGFINTLKDQGIFNVLSEREVFHKFLGSSLIEHFGSIAEILFFLLGAMTIVELIDAHQGFKVITNRVKTKNAATLLWIMGIITFFLSAMLDNLTTTIVMISLIRRLVHDDKQRLTYAGMIIIAANAGGAWSPMGDVTTTMLWIGGQISAGNIIKTLFLPSLACLVVPYAISSFFMKGDVERANYDYDEAEKQEDIRGSKVMFFVGLGALLFVPIFKLFTHLPPYIGMMLGLGVVWVVSELIHIDETEEEKKNYTAIHALSKIDTSSILFFLGILLAISSLETMEILKDLALWLDKTVGNQDIIASIIGVLSAIVDNVPLVAAAMGMYPLATSTINAEAFQFAITNPDIVHNGAFVFNNVQYFLQDAKIWEFIAYTAGTGGSMLIIGSAAGVAAMGMENINFFWYLKKIGPLAFAGYVAGIVTYLLIYPVFSMH